jgi:radical SAM protein with 4Fe4S-binding SPASM domain
MDCMVNPEISLNEWGKELVDRLGGRRYPLSATFELTERCNFNCVHCFINQPANSREVRERELSLSEIKGILNQMASEGVISLLLSGGEPLLRPDFLDIYMHAKRLGMLVTIFTNGTLLTSRILDVFSEYPPQLIEITLYGSTKKTFERITRLPKSFEAAIRGVEMVLKHGLPLNLKTMVLKVNRHELGEMKDIAEKLGVQFRSDKILWPRLDGQKGPEKFRLSPQEVIELEKQDLEVQNEWQEQDGLFSDTVRRLRSDKVWICGGGFHSFHVNAYGRMSICQMTRQPAYDLRQGNLRDGWAFLDMIREEKRTIETPCRTCSVGVMCTQCPGWSQLVYGDHETPVDYICEIGRLRANYLSNLYYNED